MEIIVAISTVVLIVLTWGLYKLTVALEPEARK